MTTDSWRKSPIQGRRMVCQGKLHIDFGEVVLVWPYDSSFICNGCQQLHCSECSYETDGETITILPCPRFFSESRGVQEMSR